MKGSNLFPQRGQSTDVGDDVIRCSQPDIASGLRREHTLGRIGVHPVTASQALQLNFFGDVDDQNAVDQKAKIVFKQ